MAASQYVFVLWGNNFNEVAATIFVTELRQAGLRVKVVGLDGDSPVGVHGLALVPDMPLSKALPLANQVTCVIVPCDPIQWQHIQHDPRLADFLAQIQQQGSWLITESVAQDRTLAWPVHVHGSSTPQAEPTTLTNSPTPEHLTHFARQLAGRMG